MMRVLAVAALLFTLGACSSAGTDAVTPTSPPVTGKPSPYAPPPPPMPEDGIACTADVRQCPDGSFVSRNPARGCAFAPCPGAGNS